MSHRLQKGNRRAAWGSAGEAGKWYVVLGECDSQGWGRYPVATLTEWISDTHTSEAGARARCEEWINGAK
jgi:hypothetical protein